MENASKASIHQRNLRNLREKRRFALMRTQRSTTLLCVFLLVGSACKRQPSHKYDYTIGVTYQNLQNEFVINIQDALRRRAEELNVRLIEVDGQGRAENQISQVENFLALDVDAIILNPFDQYGSAPVVSIAKREKKPVVVVNAVVVNLNEAGAYVGSNDQEAGTDCSRIHCRNC